MTFAEVKAARHLLDDIQKYGTMAEYLGDDRFDTIALLLGCVFWRMTGKYPQDVNRDELDPNNPAEWTKC